MAKYKILYVASEINPFLQTSEVADFVRNLPQAMQEKGMEIRILVPRFGLINERKNRLHEVVRLSGINIEVGDDEKPLIIKVASIPKAKLQVYFIDNEDYFKRRGVLHDKKGELFSDNDERMIFFTKGVVETVKKLNWSPDIIHLQGWFTSLFPLYLKTYFKDEAIFSESKIVSSIYPKDFDGVISKKFKDKVAFDEIPENYIASLSKSTYNTLVNVSIDHSDAFVLHSEDIEEEIINAIKNSKKPCLFYSETQNEKAYVDFYKKNLI